MKSRIVERLPMSPISKASTRRRNGLGNGPQLTALDQERRELRWTTCGFLRRAAVGEVFDRDDAKLRHRVVRLRLVLRRDVLRVLALDLGGRLGLGVARDQHPGHLDLVADELLKFHFLARY